MNVRELIQKLEKFDPEAKVVAFTAYESGDVHEVSENEHTKTIELYTVG